VRPTPRLRLAIDDPRRGRSLMQKHAVTTLPVVA
jgi:hypothetical protein